MPAPTVEGVAYLDTRTTAVALGPDEVWRRLRAYVDRLGIGSRNPLAVLWGTVPRSGFAVVAEVAGERFTVAGRHRFARYAIVFEVEPRFEPRTEPRSEPRTEPRSGQPTTLLHAHSYAAFPGARGRAYRALVVGTGLHHLATDALLRRLTRT